MKFHLEPVDWLLNPWRPHEPWAKPKARKFKAEKSAKWAEGVRTGKLTLAPDVGFDEALVMWNALRNKDLHAPLEDFSQTHMLHPLPRFAGAGVMALLAKLYRVDQVGDWILRMRAYTIDDAPFSDSFRVAILPYLSVEEREVLREAAHQQARESRNVYDLILTVAGLLGMSDEIATYVKASPFRRLPETMALCGLPTDEVRGVRTALMSTKHPDPLLGLIAHTGLDYLEEIAERLQYPKPAAALMGAVRDAAAAPYLIPVLDSKPKIAPLVRAWFEEQGPAASEALRAHPWRTNGQRARKHYDVAMKLAAALDSKPPRPTVDLDFGGAPDTKLPAWLSPQQLPPIVLLESEAALSDPSIFNLLAALSQQSASQIAALKDQATPESLDRWALDLMEMWRTNGMPAKERWALEPVGLFGGPRAIQSLRANVSTWAAGGRKDSALLGYRCLAGSGLREGLWALCENALAGRALAVKVAEAVARERGLTVDELADLALPDFGFDARGEREFQLGEWRLGLKAGIAELRVFDEQGKLLDALPKITDRQSLADFRELKREYEVIWKRETERLQRAFAYQREFSPQHFQRHIIPHPILGTLARTLVWGIFDDGGKLLVSFRIDEAGEWMGLDHAKVEWIPPASFVRVINSELSPRLAAQWRMMLADYEVVPPFAQLPEPMQEQVFPGGYESGLTLTPRCDPFVLPRHIRQLLAKAPASHPATAWQLEMSMKARHGGGTAIRSATRMGFDVELQDLGYQCDGKFASKTLGGVSVEIDYLDLRRDGILWRLRLRKPDRNLVEKMDPVDFETLVCEFQQLGLL